jgi:16S rRNA (guanine966-N2)-methyltransferase
LTGPSKKGLGVVRPTTGKVLESLLGTLAPYVEGARVLDLFAGSGTLGKALNDAGAGEVLYVEGHPKVAAGLPKGTLCAKLPGALTRVQGPFDIIVGDPPYGAVEGLQCLPLLSSLLAADGLVVWEHHHKDGYLDQYPGLTLWRRKRFGETALSYYRASPGSPGDADD